MRNEGEKMPMISGYARVSTTGQSTDTQLSLLREAGAMKVYCEKESGAHRDRRQLAKAIAKLAPGDTLLVTRLDRLARSTRDLLNIIHEVTERGAAFRSLADSWCDTTTAHGKLMTVLIGGIAEFERSLILARTASGRARARAAGVKFGRKPKLTPFQRSEALRRLGAGDSQVQIARSFNVNQATISRLAFSDRA
jgi:DNA invertase Pin-like site-specific DNA recombinase